MLVIQCSEWLCRVWIHLWDSKIPLWFLYYVVNDCAGYVDTFGTARYLCVCYSMLWMISLGQQDTSVFVILCCEWYLWDSKIPLCLLFYVVNDIFGTARYLCVCYSMLWMISLGQRDTSVFVIHCCEWLCRVCIHIWNSNTRVSLILLRSIIQGITK